MNAYSKIYLDDVRMNLARMLDVAIYNQKYDIESFYDVFSKSKVAFGIEQGDPRYLCGMSGYEMVKEIVEESGSSFAAMPYTYPVDRSPEYWLGWSIAFYQWKTALKFSEIPRILSIQEMLRMYPKYHEMDISHFTDCLDEIYLSNMETRLKKYREALGLSQSELARLSGVPVRTIQQYEQRQKSINKAQADYLIMLSRSLSVQPELLLENVVKSN